MKTIATLLITVLIALSACEKKESPYVIQSSSKLLVAIKENNQTFTEFLYDSLHRMIQLNQYNSDTIYRSEFYYYDQASSLVKKEYDGFVETFEYTDNGKIKTSIKYYAATNKEWKTEYQFDGDRIVKGVTFYNGSETGYINYKYDSRGNTIERSEYSTESDSPDFLNLELKLKYDDKINPLREHSNYPIDMVQNNNVIYSYLSISIMCSLSPEVNSSYEYDSTGLPIKEYRGSQTFEYVYTDRN